MSEPTPEPNQPASQQPGAYPPPPTYTPGSYGAPTFPAAQPGYPTAPQPGYPGAAQPPAPTSGYPAYGQPAAPTSGYPGAAPTSGYPSAPTSGYPGAPTSGYPGTPTSGYPGYPGATPGFPQGYPYAQPAPRKSRKGLIIALVSVFVLLVAGAGVGGFFMIQASQPKGQATPAQAAKGFLTAIYQNHSAPAAAKYVCKAARDDAKIRSVVDNVRAYEQTYDSPTVTWTEPEVTSGADKADATVTVKLVTADGRVAEKKLQLALVEDRGWWVCDATQLS